MKDNTTETILENIEHLLEKDSQIINPSRTLSEEKLPSSEDLALISEKLLAENPKASQEQLRDLLKHSLLTNTAKNEHLKGLKQLIYSILKENDRKIFLIYFDELFFEKLEDLAEKKEVTQFIEIVEIMISLVSNEKLLLLIKDLKDHRRIFTMFLNYFMSIIDQLDFNIIGISVHSSLKNLLEFLKNNGIFLFLLFLPLNSVFINK